ncbi:hypothetical protein WHZ78_18470 [Bradyrhizobium symbiodeficiens]|uniref:hypothetical protein n=1 Tax=Bradyrhizobium symbiodeficiens TaxID=1404367 RepID=UPI0030CBA793
MSDAKQRTAKPGDLLSQWWTLGAIAADRRTSGRHLKAGWVIINSYWQKHGNGRASLRFIERATGMDRKTVIRACRELDEWGHAARATGVGSRPSEYVPRWVTSASGVQTATTNDHGLSGVQMTTGVVVESPPLDGASGGQMTTESYLPEPAYKPASGRGTVSASGPDAEAPAVAGIAFERIWKAYGRYGNKQASKQAFEGITNPDVDYIASRAAAWAASAKPGQRRMPLEKWLASEKYDEADRSVRPRAEAPEPAEEGEMVRRRSSTVDATEAAEHERKLSGAAIEISVPRGVPLTVANAWAEVRQDGRWLVLDTDGGRVAVLTEAARADLQDAGQEHLMRLACACDVAIDDPAELLGKSFIIARDTFAALSERAA